VGDDDDLGNGDSDNDFIGFLARLLFIAACNILIRLFLFSMSSLLLSLDGSGDSDLDGDLDGFFARRLFIAACNILIRLFLFSMSSLLLSLDFDF
jgi:hypothetical protein